MSSLTFHRMYSRSIAFFLFLFFQAVIFNAAISQTADLSLTQTCSVDSFTQYSYVTFTTTLVNTGPSTANSINISQPIPSGLAYSSKTESQGVYNLYYQVWNVGNLAPGGSATLQLTLFTLGNTAITSFSQVQSTSTPDPDSQPNNGTAPVPAEDDEAAKTIYFKSGSGGGSGGGGGGTTNDSIDLQVTKTINNPNVNVGSIASFVITCRNNGPGSASGVKVKDLLPAGLTYSSHTSVIGTYTPATGEWNLGNIASGSERTLVLNAVVNQGGIIKNVAQVITANEPDIDSQPNNDNGTQSQDDEDFANVNGQQVDLSLDITLPVNQSSQINLNDNVTFIITLSNAGPTTSNNTKVKAFLPVGMQYVSSSATIGEWDAVTQVWVLSGIPDQNGNRPGFDIASGQTQTLTLTLKAVQSGNITFSSEVRVSNQPDIDSTPNNGVVGEDDIDSQVISVGSVSSNVDLSLSMTANTATATTGATIIYTITIQNTSAVNATGVTVKDVLPSVFTNFTSSATAGSFSSPTWNIGNLNSGATATLTLTCTAGTVTSNIINFAQVQTCTQTDGDSAPGNDSNNTANEDDEALVNLNAAINSDLSLVISANPTSVANGGTVTLTIGITNAGPLTATGVTVKAVLPTGLTLNNVSTAAGTFSGSTWTVGNIPNGTNATLILTCTAGTLSAPITVFTQVQTSNQPDGDSTPGNDTNNTANEDDEALVTISPQGFNNIDLSVSFTANNTILPLYQNIVFTVTVLNSGAVAASNVAVKYQLPSSGLAFAGSSTTSGSYDSWVGMWNIGNLAGGASATLTVTLFVVSTNPVTQFAQVWTASPTDIDSTPGNDTNNTPNEDDEAILILPYTGPQPKFIDLSLTQTATPLQASAGTNVSYTIAIQNTGDTAASNVTVKDILPAGLTYVGSTAATGSYNNATGIWTIGNLTAGGSSNLVINTTVNTITSTMINFAQVQTATGAGDDSTPGNDSNNTPNEDDEAVSSISPIGTSNGPDLELSMTSSPAQFNIYNNLAFTLTISNTGNQAATNIKVNFGIPLTTAFVSKSQTAGNYDAWTRDWTLPSLAAGSSASMTLTVFTLSNAGPVTAFAQVTQQSPADADSAPNNAVSPVATEDDEVVLNVPPVGGGQALSIELDQQVPFVVQSVFPNPTEDWIDIEVTSIAEETVTLEFYNANGAMIKSLPVELHYGYNHIEENLYDWKAGTYYAIFKGMYLRGKPIRFIKL